MAAISPTTVAESCAVTSCQWRSMKTKATSAWSSTTGAMMMISARANRPLGRIALMPRVDTPPARRASRAAAGAGASGRASPSAPVSAYAGDRQPVADAAHGLQVERIGRVGLDLAAQAVDLHVDGALAGRAAGHHQLVAAHRLAGRGGEDRQDLALALGQVDDLAAALQFQLLAVEGERAEAELLDQRRGRAASARLRMALIRSSSSRGSNGLAR